MTCSSSDCGDPLVALHWHDPLLPGALHLLQLVVSMWPVAHHSLHLADPQVAL